MVAVQNITTPVKVVKEVAAQGWAACYTSSITEALSLAALFGQPRQGNGESLVEELRIRDSADAPPRSLSAMHGTGGFPLHTDYAHWHIPPRFVLLRSNASVENVRPTTILPLVGRKLHNTDMEQLRRHVWKVAGNANPFYARILRVDNNCEILRFDLACMTPAYASAAVGIDIIQKAHALFGVIHFEWSFGVTLIIDNWRTLHGRSNIEGQCDASRILQRIIVMRNGTVL